MTATKAESTTSTTTKKASRASLMAKVKANQKARWAKYRANKAGSKAMDQPIGGNAAEAARATQAILDSHNATAAIPSDSYKIADVHFAKALTEHEALEAGAKTRALHCGLHLAKAQEALPHGMWGPYLHAKQFPARTATRYVTYAAKLLQVARDENTQATEKQLIKAAEILAVKGNYHIVTIANSGANAPSAGDQKQLAAPADAADTSGKPSSRRRPDPSPSDAPAQRRRPAAEPGHGNDVTEYLVETMTADCAILAESDPSKIKINLDTLMALIETLTYTADKLSTISAQLRSENIG